MIQETFYNNLYSDSLKIINTAKLKINKNNFVEKAITILDQDNIEALSESEFAQLLVAVLLSESAYENAFCRFVIKKSSEQRKKYFQNKVKFMAPVEVSSFCSSTCSFCGWNSSNKEMTRKQLSLEKLLEQAGYLYNKGIRHFEISAGDDIAFLKKNLAEYIYQLKKKYSDIEVSQCVVPLEQTEYALLRDKGLDFAFVWQETYASEIYNRYINNGPKRFGVGLYQANKDTNGYMKRIKSHEKAILAGINPGLGVLAGLNTDYATDFLALYRHVKKLLETYSTKIDALVIGFPKICDYSFNLDSSFDNFDTKLLSLLSALLFFSLKSNKIWCFANCRFSFVEQISMLEHSSYFSSSEVVLMPGGYGKSQTSQIHEGEQFLHHANSHEVFLKEITKRRLCEAV